MTSVIQLAAVLAVLWFYRHDLGARLRDLASPDRDLVFWRNLVVAEPAAILGFALGDLITSHLFTSTVVAVAMIGGGVVLWLVERFKPYGDEASRVTSLDRVSVRQAVIIGVVQLAALYSGHLAIGVEHRRWPPRPTRPPDRDLVLLLHLAIPTLGGATAYALVKNLDTIQARGDLLPLGIGMLAAFITALVSIRWMLGYVAHHDFRIFAAYRIGAGVSTLALIRP